MYGQWANLGKPPKSILSFLRRSTSESLEKISSDEHSTSKITACFLVIWKKIGQDWIFLALLGVLMALISLTMDCKSPLAVGFLYFQDS